MKPPAPKATVDAQHPWLGLVSYTEETRAYFHGREEEAAELGRRVQRKLLTVLFGQSGLGKTSILQAGLVPRLRPEGFCPVYVRLDYDPSSPSPADQIKRAVFLATESAGTWTQSGSAITGETLWEFLHHRDDVLKDPSGRTLIPILIFDQFEEIFTLAQSDDAGRRRAQEFLADLSDLVENRPPAALELRIERDEADASRFDFARADYRVLISLREDYLAHLEGLKGQMPSVTQNRMRLARMTGSQAVAAVRAPAPHLVSEAVAESVVRFVAGGTDLSRAEVEPSLLSLICRELNDARLALGHAEISADLLAGSRDTILTEFYERALADQPPGIRVFIEDVMLTDSGFRESVAEERVRKAFAAAGAKPDALALLVDRRLLRVEDRLDLRRVEITHDVLCSVVAASRRVRREREALEESKRQLAAQREREVATRRALMRARTVAVVAVVIMLAAVGSAVFGWMNLRRARAAETAALAAGEAARHTRELADAARRQAEQLLSYLVGDFYRDLVATGQVELFEQLAQRTVDYYQKLPPELVTDSTERNRALALAALGRARNEQNRTDEAMQPINQAIEVLKRRVASGDASVDTLVGLSLALRTRSALLTNQLLNTEALRSSEEAAAVLRPLIAAGKAPQSAQLEYAEALLDLGQSQAIALTMAEADPALAEARERLAALGGPDPKNVQVASLYALALFRMGRGALSRGDNDAAQALEEQGIALANKLLEDHPGRIQLLNYRGIGLGYLYTTRIRQGRTKDAYDVAVRSEADYTTYLRMSPTSGTIWNNMVYARARIGNALLYLGRVTESRKKFNEALATADGHLISSGMADTLAEVSLTLAYYNAEMHDAEGAAQAREKYRHYVETSLKDTPAERFAALTAKDEQTIERLVTDILLGRPVAPIKAELVATLQRVESIPADDPATGKLKGYLVKDASYGIAEASLDLGQYEDAERYSKKWGDAYLMDGLKNDVDRGNYSQTVNERAKALVGMGKYSEARALIEPQLEFVRKRSNASPDNQIRLLDLAEFVATDAAAQERSAREDRRRLLDEAQRLINSLSPEVIACEDPQIIVRYIASERAKLDRGE
jgi:hypothetical protein